MLTRWKIWPLTIAILFLFSTVLSAAPLTTNRGTAEVKHEKEAELIVADVEITSEIEELARELNYNRGKIISYVKQNIDYQPYYGLVKGPNRTYWEKAGNDFDQASLLIALLSASNIPARYVVGEIRLSIKRTMNWVGVETPEAAVKVFSSNDIPFSVIKSKTGKIQRFKFDHVWVEYECKNGRNKRLISVSPSFKQYRYHKGIDIKNVTGFDMDDLCNNALEGAEVTDNFISGLNETNLTALLNEYNNNILAYADSMSSFSDKQLTVGDIVGYRNIKKHSPRIHRKLNRCKNKKTFTKLPDSMKYLVGFQIPGIDYSVDFPSIVNKSIVVSYHSLDDTTAVPVLKIDGMVVAEGTPVTIGSRQTLISGFRKPGENGWTVNNKTLTVSATYAIVFDAQKMPIGFVKKRLERLKTLNGQDELEESLYIAGIAYFAKTDALADIAAKLKGVVWTRQLSQVIVSQNVRVVYKDDIPFDVYKGPKSIDVKRNILNPISTTNNYGMETEWMLAISAIGSIEEGDTLEQLFGSETVSSIKVIGLANSQDIKIFTINSDNIDEIMPQIDTHESTKTAIEESVSQGFTVLCPQKDIELNNWTGIGWIVIDSETGSMGYMLAGRLSNDDILEIINGGSGTLPHDGGTAHMIVHVIDWTINLQHLGISATYIGVVGYYSGPLLALGPVGATLGGAALISTGLLIGGTTLYMIYQQN